MISSSSTTLTFELSNWPCCTVPMPETPGVDCCAGPLEAGAEEPPDLHLVVDHPEYQHDTELAPETIAELLGDLRNGG